MAVDGLASGCPRTCRTSPTPTSRRPSSACGMARDMVAPLWEGVTLIPDEVTLAGAGPDQVITAVMLHAVKILRSDGFYKQETQHA